MARQTIRDCDVKSIRLENIPGLLTIQKIKPKQASKSTRVTQVHGSMEGKEVIKVVKRINEDKQKTLQLKQDEMKAKEKEKEDFYRCKRKCVCKEHKCPATDLKECPSCHSILRSICSKACCKINGKKPEMILPAAAVNKKKSK